MDGDDPTSHRTAERHAGAATAGIDADPEREGRHDRVAPPADLRPMLATPAVEAPAGDGWAFEVKWDGVRVVAVVDGGRVVLTGRRGNDVSALYPEVRGLGDRLGATSVVLDGEVVAVEPGGRPSFQLLQRRMNVAAERVTARLQREVPVAYMTFDVLWIDGELLTGRPYRERRERLEALAPAGPHWQTPPVEIGSAGARTAEVCRAFGLEGMVAKRLDGRYTPGRRSRSWLKIKWQRSQEMVVGGWMPGRGRREGSIGSMLVGYHDTAAGGALRYAGRVGSGLDGPTLEALGERLSSLRRATSPFALGRTPAGAVFVEPELVVDVSFQEWTAGGGIRHPVYRGVRYDKEPGEVVREEPTAGPAE